jgi:hypothetical protein
MNVSADKISLMTYYLNARYYNPSTGRFILRDAAPQMAKDQCTILVV